MIFITFTLKSTEQGKLEKHRGTILGTRMLGGVFRLTNNLLYSLLGLNLVAKKGRLTEFKQDDIVLVSYPKSGSTWMMFLVGNIIDPSSPTDFFNVHQRIPDINLHDARKFGKYTPRFLRSHEHFDRNYPKVIYIVRDPRSVAVSYYFHLLKRYQIPESTTFDQFFEGFLTDVNEQGNWGEHVGSWLGAWKNQPDRFHLLRYEDIKSDTNNHLKQALAFAGVKVGDDEINKAIELSSFERMQNTEQVQKDLEQNLKKSDQSILNVRKGTVDEYKKYFNEEQNERLYKAFGSLMDQLGYKKEL